ncbi:MAG: hypothetical protein ACTHN5_15995 [Phycisphaerae bacterium]
MFGRIGMTGLFSAAVVAALAGAASANTVDIATLIGATVGGNPVSADALVTTGNGTVTVVLTNLIVDPTTVGQNISGFSFTLSDVFTTDSLTSSSGLERMVHDDGSYTDGGLASTGWAESSAGKVITLNLLGTSEAPDHTIIGSPALDDKYDSAGGSIDKTSGPHNPFFTGPVTFNLSVLGVTSATTVTAANFQFNTSAGSNESNVNITTVVPLPPAVLSGMGMLGMLGIGGKLRKKFSA